MNINKNLNNLNFRQALVAEQEEKLYKFMKYGKKEDFFGPRRSYLSDQFRRLKIKSPESKSDTTQVD